MLSIVSVLDRLVGAAPPQISRKSLAVGRPGGPRCLVDGGPVRAASRPCFTRRRSLNDSGHCYQKAIAVDRHANAAVIWHCPPHPRWWWRPRCSLRSTAGRPPKAKSGRSPDRPDGVPFHPASEAQFRAGDPWLFTAYRACRPAGKHRNKPWVEVNRMPASPPAETQVGVPPEQPASRCLVGSVSPAGTAPFNHVRCGDLPAARTLVP